jgi:hypothetical protein
MAKIKTFISGLLSPLYSWVGGKKFIFVWLGFFLLSAILSISRADVPFTSQWDEMYHLSYVQYVSEGVIPAIGYPMNDWAKIAFSCYPVSSLGIMTFVPCGEVGPGALYPTGGTNSASVWPPIYYIIIAILMAPIKLLFGLTDNLLAARYATALIWAIGSSLLSFFIYRKSKSFMLGATFAMLSTALSLFGQSASFVSPHSLVPLLLFGGVSIAVWLDRELKTVSTDYSIRNLKPMPILKRGLLWLTPIVGYGSVLAFSVPHAFPILIAMAIFVAIGVLFHNRDNLPGLVVKLTTLGIFFALAVVAFMTTRDFWSWQRSSRAVDWPSDVNPGAADVDALSSYPDMFQQALSLWGDFWPNGLQNPWLQGTIAVVNESFWIFLLPTLIFASIATLGLSHWLSRMSIALVATAPVASNLAFLQLQFVIPERYGLSIVLLGLFGLANDKIQKFFRIFIFAAATATYIISYLYSPLPVIEAVCPTGPLDWAFGCRLP